MRKLLLMLMVLLPAARMSAQDDPQYRMEIGAGVGMVSYEGDFNGNVLKNMQPMFSALWRYNFDPYKDLRLCATYGKLKGSSKDVDTYYPDYATEEYSFNRNLLDVSLVFEYNFWPYGTGRDYRGAKRLTPYIYGGIGATSASGGGSKSVFTANVPIGLGVKYKLNERMNLGLDWGIHFSLSDELDGVKDPYQVKSSGMFKNTDCYSMLQLTLTYSFKAKCRTCNKEE
uniref:type IX secretion system protein PorG n=1 Tax=Prevotella sp. TaxID=59823 RepID=UPI0040287205